MSNRTDAFSSAGHRHRCLSSLRRNLSIFKICTTLRVKTANTMKSHQCGVQQDTDTKKNFASFI